MQSNNNKTPSLLMIILLVGFPQLSETIYTPSLPDIAQSLQAASHLVEWTLSIYFVGFAVGTVFWGSWSDKIGRRPAMLLGLVVYCLGTLACFLADSIDLLLAARFFQALGASVGSIITITMIRDVFVGKVRHQLFAKVGMALGLAPALGPIIGGYLVQWFAWQANFIFLFIVGLSLFFYTLLSLPETRPATQKPHSLNEFLRIAKRLGCDKHVWGCALAIGGINGLLFSYYAEAPFIYINVLKASPSIYGWFTVGIAVAGVLGSMLSHWLNEYLKPQRIILIGGGIMTLSAIAFVSVASSGVMSASHGTWAYWSVLLPSAFIIFGGMGVAIPNLISIALEDYQDTLGRAGSLFGFLYYSVVSGATMLMGVLHNGTVFPMPLYFLVLSLGVFLVASTLIFKTRQ